MTVTNIHQAKTHLSKLIASVEEGKEVIIARAGKPVAKLVPYHAERKARKPGGGWKGRVWMADDFDDLPENLAALFRGSDR